MASGTATLEAALLNTPHVLVYRTGALTYRFAKAVLDISYVGLVNLLANREVCPELIQEEAHPEALLDRLLPLVEEGEPRRQMLEGFESIRTTLGIGRVPLQWLSRCLRLIPQGRALLKFL